MGPVVIALFVLACVGISGSVILRALRLLRRPLEREALPWLLKHEVELELRERAVKEEIRHAAHRAIKQLHRERQREVRARRPNVLSWHAPEHDH
jgi:hypothetical protein